MTWQQCLRALAVLVLAPMVLMGAGDESARVDRLGHQMMCACGCNQILLECNHVGCTYSDRMRKELVAAVDAGNRDDAILESFIQKYGTTILAAPTKTGFNRVAWIMPYLVLTAGTVLVALVVKVWRKRLVVGAASMQSSAGGGELDRFREQARRETEL